MLKYIFKILVPAMLILFLHLGLHGQTTLFSEDFENGGSIPAGWTQDYESGTIDWTFQAGNTGSVGTAHGGSYNALFQNNSFGDETTKLVSPELDLSGYTSINLKFWHLQEDWNGDVTFLKVYYKTSSGGAWTEIGSYTAIESSWTQTTIALPNTNSTYYIAFEGIAKYARGAGVDDVLIEGVLTGESDIIAAGNETPNIDYTSYLSSSFSANSDGVRVWSFTLRDDFGDNAIDGDPLDIIDISFTKGAGNTVASWANTINRAAIYDGATEVGEVDVTGESIDFSGLSALTCADNGTKTYDLYITFETTVTDNEQFEFQVTESDITVDAGSSYFGNFTADSDTDSDKNRIVVNADRWTFTQQPTNTATNTVMSPAVTVSATDLLGNVDADYASTAVTISSTGNISAGTTTQNTASGVATFNDIEHDITGTYQMTASGGTFSDINSNNYDITISVCSPPTVSSADTDDYISNVTFEGIDNTTGNTDGYADYTAQLATVEQGAVGLPVDVSLAGTESYEVYVFFDWDNNGDFDGTGEAPITNETSFPQNIDVPATAATTSVRMRVVLSYNTVTDGCGTSLTWGEVEDYTVLVEPPGESDIQAAGNETPSINYNNYTASDINGSSNAVRVWSFTIRDGGASSPDADSDPTSISDISFTKGADNTVASWSNTILRAAVYDGATEIDEVPVVGETIDFSGLSTLTAPDDGTHTYDLYLTFESPTAGEQFDFQLTDGNVSAGASSSGFTSFTASSDVDNNKNLLVDISPEMILENTSAQAGDPVSVTVTAKEIVDMVGFQFTVEYDETKLTYIDCSNWDASINGAAVLINSSTPGKLMFVYNNWPTETDIADAKFFDINFTVDASAPLGNTCLNWSDDPTPRELSDVNASIINADWTNGCVNVVPPPPTITIRDTVGVAGDAVVVDVWAESLTGLVGFQWSIDYDETKLSFDGTSNWSQIQNAPVTVFDDGDKLMFSHSNYVDGAGGTDEEIDIADGLFFNLDFTILGGATGDACFTWSDNPTPRELSDISPSVIPDVVWADGCVSVVDGYWTGEVSAEWDDIYNWSDRVVPSLTKDAVIPDVSGASGNFPDIVVPAECLDLDIRANARVDVNVNGSITVHGNIINDAANGYNGLVIHSDATGTGSLISTTAGVDASVESFIEGANYHYISTPVDITPASNFFPLNFYQWDASMEWGGLGADPYGSPSTMDINPWTNPSGNLTVGEGYAWAYQTTTINYQGNLNQGDITVNLSKYTGALTLGDQDPNYQGWNFVGNPYPSAIDWDLVEADYDANTNIESAIYFFDDDGDAQHYNYKYYVPASPNGVVLGAGTNGGTNIVPVGQGFFIRSDADAQSFTISNSHRVHSNQALYKKEKSAQPNILRFELENAFSSDEAIVRLADGATLNFDARYDARKLFPTDYSMPQIYSISPQEEIIAINTIPRSINYQRVPLGVLSQNEGECRIRFTEVNLEDEIIPYLVDNYLQDSVIIEVPFVYEFQHQGGMDTERFHLLFAKDASSNSVVDEEQVILYPNPNNGHFRISSQINIEQIIVCDITGRKTAIIESDFNNINLNHLQSGIYHLKILLADKQVVRRNMVIK